MKKVIFRIKENSALYALTSPDFAHKEIIFRPKKNSALRALTSPEPFSRILPTFFRWTPRICFQAYGALTQNLGLPLDIPQPEPLHRTLSLNPFTESFH